MKTTDRFNRRAISAAVIASCLSILCAGTAQLLLKTKAAVVSDDGIWELTESNARTMQGYERIPQRARVFQLNDAALMQALNEAPMEQGVSLEESQAIISLPMPDGSFARFRIVESPVMEASLAARFPEIRSYRGEGVEDNGMTVRFDWTPQGLHAFAADGTRTVSIHPVARGDRNRYVSHFGSEYSAAAREARCLVDEAKIIRRFLPNRAISSSAGTLLRKYRIAVAATSEYCSSFGNPGGGSTNAQTIASINT
jgi:hypothetical protein